MHILIIGAGYAGLRAAIELDRRRAAYGDRLDVTLLDQHPYHQLVQELHLAATTASDPTNVIVPLQTILQRRAVQLCLGRVQRIEPLERQVWLADGQILCYDRLLIALGAETNYAHVPGAREHTLPLRSYEQALRLRAHIAACVEAAARATDPRLRRILLTFVIVGGGYTGCQVAGELVPYVCTLATASGIARNELRIALIERSGLLLKQAEPWANAYAQHVFADLGVRVYLQTTVARVVEQALYTTTNQVFRAGTIIWVAGIRAPALLAESGLPTDALGRVRVDRYLRVAEQALIFAAGDCASIPPAIDGPIPATASYAMRQGEHLAGALLADIQGKAPQAYTPLRLGEVVSLGPGAAVGNPLGIPLTGMPAVLLKQGIEAWYRSTLL